MVRRKLEIFIFIVPLLIACAAEPPAPERMAEQMTAPGNVLWLPAVASPEPVRGWARAYSNLSDAEMQQLGIEWYYDYALRHPLPHRAGAEYVPFLWCDIYPALAYNAPAIRYFERLAQLPEGYDGYVLFLNEPDLRGATVDGGQCERTPRQAAYMLKAARQVCPACRFVGPVVSHEDYLQAWPWLRGFYIEAARLGVRLPEVSAIHTYLTENPQYIIDSHFHLLGQFPGAATTAWVTEFATSSPDLVARMIAYYESDPRITRYGWFTARGWRADADLITADGQVTAVGQAWLKARPGTAPDAYP
jgi:hypothetical protein